MQTYLCPIGAHSTRIKRVVLSRGLSTADTVVLLRPATEIVDDRVEQTRDDINQLMETLRTESTVTVECVPHDAFSTAVRRCSRMIQAAQGTIIATLNSGFPDINVPFTVAVLAHAAQIDTALTVSDIDTEIREVTLPTLSATVPTSAWETLSSIAATEDEGISLPDLTAQTDYSHSTIIRHVQTLAENNAVTTWHDGNTKYAQITLTGQLLRTSH